MSCTLSTAYSRTDTSGWDACVSSTVGTGIGSLSAEVSAEVCRSGSSEREQSGSSEYTMTTQAGQPVVACQSGRYIEVDGKTYVSLVTGMVTYDGKICQETACPPSSSDKDASVAAHFAQPIPLWHLAAMLVTLCF